MVVISRNCSVIGTALIFLFTLLCAEKHISGDISKITFNTADNPYIVDKDILVPNGVQVTIPAGTVLLFDTKGTFLINGTCFVAGTAQNPVVFTSVNDSISPVKSAPSTIFDWNGIVISPSAPIVALVNVIIKYAEHPLESKCPDLQLRNCIRIKTSDDFFTLNGTAFTVDAGVPFFNPKPVPEALPDSNTSGHETSAVPSTPAAKTETTPSTINWRIVSTAGAGALGVGAGVVGILRGVKASVNYDSSGMSFANHSRNDSYYSRYKKFYVQSALAFTGSGLCFCAAAYCYFFYFKNTNEKQVLFIPNVNPAGKEYGLTMELRW